MLTRRQVVFVSVFAVAGFLALQVPVATLVGSKAKFTLFDAVGPIAPAFLGTLPGLLAVFLMQLSNFVFHGAQVVDAGTIIRFFPMLAGAWYFGSKNRAQLVLPILAIIGFLAHPNGREAWYYALYWLIPLACFVARDRWLLARSLGATFTAHSVGGVLWIWAFNTPAAVWAGLVPIVAVERIGFAIGISLAYVVATNLVAALATRFPSWSILSFDNRLVAHRFRTVSPASLNQQ